MSQVSENIQGRNEDRPLECKQMFLSLWSGQSLEPYSPPYTACPKTEEPDISSEFLKIYV